jgi:hypothetical protein
LRFLAKGAGNEATWQPRPLKGLNEQLSAVYGAPVSLSGKLEGLAAVAQALNEGDLVKAQLVALFLELPEPVSPTSGAAGDSDEIVKMLDESGILQRLWDPEKHPRWPAGSPVGGEFAPASGGLASPGATHLFSDQGAVPFEGPLAMPRVAPIPRFPTEVLPPPVFPALRNPYPARPECVKEWADAEKYCRELADQGLLGKHPYIGHGSTFDQCIRGQVSEDCGGNPVA